MLPKKLFGRSEEWWWRMMPFNKSANTEPQLQEAASPQWLWLGCLQR